MPHRFRHHIGRLVTTALLAMTVLPNLSLAQEAAPEEATPLPRGAISFGAFWLKPGVQIPEVGIDTNVYNEAGRRDPDLVVTVQPSLDLGIRTRRFDLTVTPLVAIVHFGHAASERSINPAFSAKTERRFSSRAAVYAQGAAGYSRDRYGLEIDARALRYGQQVTVGTRLSGRRLGLDVHASESDSQYHPAAKFNDVSLARELNRTSRSAGIDVGYRLTSFTSSSVGVLVVADRFAKAPERSTDSIRLLAGLEFKPRALVSGGIRGGYGYARSLRGTAPEFSGVVASGGLNFTWRDSFSLSGGLARDIEFSYQLDHPYYVYDLFEGSAQKAFLKRMDAGVGMSYTMLNYRSYFYVPSTEGKGTQTRLRNTSASIGVRITSGVRLGVYVARWERCCGAGWSKSDRVGFQVGVGRVRIGQETSEGGGQGTTRVVGVGRVNVSERGVFMPGPRL